MAVKIQLTREQALAKAILSKLHDRNEFRDLLNGVTGEILGAAEELRGTTSTSTTLFTRTSTTRSATPSPRQSSW